MVKKYFEGNYFHRSVFLLPNMLTSLNLFCGFYSVISSIEENFVVAALFIIVAGVFDILDGRLARATNTTSQFGVEYDSMADLISFGLAPGLLVYLWVLRLLGRMGWMAAFLFVVCGALRLARYNMHTEVANNCNGSSGTFIGLPITAGAGMIAITVLFFFELGLGACTNPYIILFMLYFISFLMVGTVKYANFRRSELFKSIRFNILIVILLVFMFVADRSSIVVLFVCSFLYVLSGPFRAVLQIKSVNSKTRDVIERLE